MQNETSSVEQARVEISRWSRGAGKAFGVAQHRGVVTSLVECLDPADARRRSIVRLCGKNPATFAFGECFGGASALIRGQEGHGPIVVDQRVRVRIRSRALQFIERGQQAQNASGIFGRIDLRIDSRQFRQPVQLSSITGGEIAVRGQRNRAGRLVRLSAAQRDLLPGMRIEPIASVAARLRNADCRRLRTGQNEQLTDFFDFQPSAGTLENALTILGRQCKHLPLRDAIDSHHIGNRGKAR
ncbi:MAG: hypothetical protein J0I77_14625 [Rudaea sp.]|uniref:hypothetical protein n=1 Tax=Rudaea sp. TaxID=2136325 RepID=UPI001AD018AD|nr:hypothetical protein [Rudaea sp.]MBN8886953.1 hypothetical protein [Rudaea sp.]MBR0346449.1 hypothetical protein [Rudaea sp.]